MAYAALPPPPPVESSHSFEPFTSGATESFMEDFSRANPDLPRRLTAPPNRNVVYATLGFVWRIFVLPAMGLAYLAFCYACHYSIVRIAGALPDGIDPMAHLPIIKAGVTSVTILYVTISLLPLYSLISDLKSEEFFRILSGRRAGVPLNSVNSISTPSYGYRDTLVTLCRRHASIYFTGAFFSGLVAIAASTLAPAALSVGTVLFDGDLIALSVGAIDRNSVLNMTDINALIFDNDGPSSTASERHKQAGSIAWAEFSLGVNYSFQSPKIDSTTFIIPTPPKLSPGTNARWLSDVIAMQPRCEWIAPEFPSGPSLNFTDKNVTQLTMNLTSKHMQVTLDAHNLNHSETTLELMRSGWAEGFGKVGFSGSIFNLNTRDDITNGATVFAVVQCAVGCARDEFSLDMPINITFSSEMHTSRYISSNGHGVDISFLYCDPQAEIQTRHVSNDGKGALSIGDKTSTAQGNLHPGETSLLLSYALIELAEAGPKIPSNVSQFGNQVQFGMFFGNPGFDATQIPMKSLDSITASYASILQSAVKPFLDGSLASAHVPARATRELVVFSSSLPHLVASTVLYVLLTIFVLACHFRKHAAQFTFFAIAARLARSDIPPLFAELKGPEQKEPGAVEEAALSSLKKARVLLEGGDVLQLRHDIL